jgi:hypothetical protein
MRVPSMINVQPRIRVQYRIRVDLGIRAKPGKGADADEDPAAQGKGADADECTLCEPGERSILFCVQPRRRVLHR